MGSRAQRLPERVVLVVDDEDLVRRMTTRALTDAGFRVFEAHDGEEAASLLATLGTNVIGVIVSDIRMPRLDGLQLAALVSQRWPTVPLILMSGQGGPPAGYYGPFCAKPFSPETSGRGGHCLGLRLLAQPAYCRRLHVWRCAEPSGNCMAELPLQAGPGQARPRDSLPIRCRSNSARARSYSRIVSRIASISFCS